MLQRWLIVHREVEKLILDLDLARINTLPSLLRDQRNKYRLGALVAKIVSHLGERGVDDIFTVDAGAVLGAVGAAGELSKVPDMVIGGDREVD